MFTDLQLDLRRHPRSRHLRHPLLQPGRRPRARQVPSQRHQLVDELEAATIREDRPAPGALGGRHHHPHLLHVRVHPAHIRHAGPAPVLQALLQHHRAAGDHSEVDGAGDRLHPALRSLPGALLDLLLPVDLRHVPSDEGAEVRPELRRPEGAVRDPAGERDGDVLLAVPHDGRRRRVRRERLLLRDLARGDVLEHAGRHVLGHHHDDDGGLRGHGPEDGARSSHRRPLRAHRCALHRPVRAHHRQQLRPVLLDGSSPADAAAHGFLVGFRQKGRLRKHADSHQEKTTAKTRRRQSDAGFGQVEVQDTEYAGSDNMTDAGCGIRQRRMRKVQAVDARTSSKSPELANSCSKQCDRIAGFISFSNKCVSFGQT